MYQIQEEECVIKEESHLAERLWNFFSLLLATKGRFNNTSFLL